MTIFYYFLDVDGISLLLSRNNWNQSNLLDFFPEMFLRDETHRWKNTMSSKIDEQHGIDKSKRILSKFILI